MMKEQLAQLFHETYERRAPEFGYATRPETAKRWEEIPWDNANKRLMVAVAGDVLEAMRVEEARETGIDYDEEEVGDRVILARRWITMLGAYVGVVAARTGMHEPEQGEWMAYIGLAGGMDGREDALRIAQWGAKLSPHEAHGFFPRLDISKYKGEK